VIVGRDAHEATGFDKDALNRSMKMFVPTMGPNTDFKQWKRNLLTLLSLKAAYFIPHLAIRESGVGLDDEAQHYAYALVLHATSENKRADDRAVKSSVSAARPDFATTA
jgi:spore cortex formation protein SpoVR/YcgB (stage V sporulation)